MRLIVGGIDVDGAKDSVGAILDEGLELTVEVGFELTVGSDDFDGAVDVDGDDVTEGETEDEGVKLDKEVGLLEVDGTPVGINEGCVLNEG